MLGWLRSIVSRSERTIISLVSNYMAHLQWPLADLADRFMRLVSEGYRKNSVVYACIRLKGQSVPEAPLKVYGTTADGKREELPNHPLRKLIEYVNPYQTEFEFWELTCTYLDLVGRASWWKERDRTGRPVALWPLRPDRIAPMLGKPPDPLLRGWAYFLDGEMYELPASDVMMFTYPDPGDETGGVIGGYGPLQVLAREVDADNEATSFTFALLKNYAMPGVVIKHKSRLDEASAQQLKDKFRNKYGSLHRGEPAVIDMDADIVPVSQNLQQLEFPDLRSIAESRITAAFGVPAILVGVKVGLDHATYSNAAEAREFFTETTLSVMWRRLSDQVYSDLVPEYPDSMSITVKFDTSDVKALQGQKLQTAQRYADGFTKGALTINEYRRLALDLPPLVGGDVRLLPITTQEVAAAEVTSVRTFLPAGVRTARSAADAAGWGAAVERKVNALRDSLAPRLDAYWRKWGRAVVAKLPTETKAAAIPDDLWPDEADAEMEKMLKAHWQASIDQSKIDAVALLSLDFDLPMDEVRSVLGQVAGRVTKISDTTRNDIRTVISDALAGSEGQDYSGATLSDIRDRLTGMFEQTYHARSMAIARTESATAYNQGSVLSYRSSSVVDEVEIYDGDDCGWTSHDDPDLANGSVRSLDDFADYPVAHPNCVRAGAPIVRGQKE